MPVAGDYTISTDISWQHFPRSTSSRSRCDSSDAEKILTPTLTPVEEKSVFETEVSTKLSSTEYPIVSLYD